MSTHTPHPEHDLARRITALETSNPDLMIWKPAQSVSGNWEAMGNGWTIEDPDPSRFYDRVSEQLK